MDDDELDLAPYLELAKEIRHDVQAAAADGTADLETVVAAIGRLPQEERERLARAVFDDLPPEEQWAVLERAFGDHEITHHLAGVRAARVDRLRAEGDTLRVAEAAAAAGLLDTRDVPAGARLTLGLFREHDVSAAVARGHLSDSCARRVELHGEGGGRFRVVEDVFNPRRGHFVTREYDESTWQAERLEPHAHVRLGALLADGRLDPVIVPGARLDLELEGSGPHRGRLHVGFVMLARTDVFAG